MFNNKFTKNDPLADSVKSVMEQNNLRRQVENALNEELGIASRKALPHEHLANYDALLEARIAEAELSPKQQKIASIAGNPKEIDRQDLAALRAKKTVAEAEALPKADKYAIPGSKKTQDRLVKTDSAGPESVSGSAQPKSGPGGTGVTVVFKKPQNEEALDEVLDSPEARAKYGWKAVASYLTGNKNIKRKRTAGNKLYTKKVEKAGKALAKSADTTNALVKSARKLKENITFDSVMEEIAYNLNEKAAYVLENFSYEDQVAFFESLTEEQFALLDPSLMESGGMAGAALGAQVARTNAGNAQTARMAGREASVTNAPAASPTGSDFRAPPKPAPTMSARDPKERAAISTQTTKAMSSPTAQGSVNVAPKPKTSGVIPAPRPATTGGASVVPNRFGGTTRQNFGAGPGPTLPGQRKNPMGGR